MACRTIRNENVSLTVDSRGRIVSLRNERTRTEIITVPQAAEAWRMIVPTGRHTVEFVRGSEQTPDRIESVRRGGTESIEMSYSRIVARKTRRVKARFVLSLEDGAREVRGHAELRGGSDLRIDELEFPILGGVEGFAGRGQRRLLNLVAAGDRGNLYADVLHRGLPDTGRESNHFVREHETAMFESDGVGGVWVDLWSPEQGLFLGYCSTNRDFVFKIEKYPKEVPNAPHHFYPADVRRWARVSALHVPRWEAGGEWISEPVVIMPHEGDWHAGAHRYAAYRHEGLRIAPSPSWMDGFLGWTEILGKTYLGEVFHDYAHCADAVVRDKRVTGLDLVFYYGHSRIGSEGADFDHTPAPDLGGRKGFRKMVEKLHRHSVRIMLLDHFHRWINQDVPEYKALRLWESAVLDAERRPVTARWWKETYLSCRLLEGPTPVWVEMCPSSKTWREYYLDHITKMIHLGVDGLELDTFECSRCFNPRHGHAVGADTFPMKMDLVRAARARARRLNPEFVLIGETMMPETREVFDGFYSSRFLTEQERIYRYLFPEIRQQTVLVGNHAYDQVNKALMLGVGVNTEIWGLRRTALDGCPELARYIGEVNRFKRRHAEVLLHGTFRDTLGAVVKGDCYFSVLESAAGDKALVVRNPNARRVAVEGRIDGVAGHRLVLWRPFAGERALRSLPLRLTLPPYGVAVVLAHGDRAHDGASRTRRSRHGHDAVADRRGRRVAAGVERDG